MTAAIEATSEAKSTAYTNSDDSKGVGGFINDEFNAARNGSKANSPEQKARLDEIERLESKGDQMTVSDQLRVLELKAAYAHANGTMTDAEYEMVTGKLDGIRERLEAAMSTGNKSYDVANRSISELEELGINTAGSPLETLRNTLKDGTVSFAESTSEAAKFARQQADSYAVGSSERKFWNSRADKLDLVCEYLMNNGTEVNLEKISDWENLTFSDLRGITSENLKAEASVFGDLAKEREDYLRRSGKTEEEIAADPLLTYYKMRESNASKAAVKVGKAEKSGDPNQLLNARMSYVSDLKEADRSYWVNMGNRAKLEVPPDETFIADCETRARGETEIIDTINNAWRTMSEAYSRIVNEIVSKG